MFFESIGLLYLKLYLTLVKTAKIKSCMQAKSNKHANINKTTNEQY